MKYWLLFFVFIASSWPLLQSGMFKIHDFTHGARIAEMSRALSDGHFPVRWSQSFGFGYGMPLFQFYGPLPFYIGVIFYWLSNNLIFSVKTLFLIANALTLVGGYLLGKKLFKNDWAALGTSLAMSLAPYRFLNLYVRGALSELWGIMALPWIVWAAIKVIRNESWGWLMLVMSLSFLFLSHNISTMIFFPFIVGIIVVYLIAYCLNQKLNILEFFQAIKRLVFSGLLALGTCAFYLFPAYFEKDLTQVDDFILAEYFNFRIHFLYLKQFFRPNWGFGGSEYGPDDPITFFLGYGQIMALILGLVMLYLLSRKYFLNKNKKNQAVLFFVVGVLFLLFFSLFMTTWYSGSIWETLTLLEYSQFPWRFLGISIFLMSIIVGIVLTKTKKFFYKRKINLIINVFIILAILLNLRFTQPEKFLDNPEDFYYFDSQKISAEMSHTLADYVPQDFNLDLKPAQSFIVEQSYLEDGTVQVLENKTHYKRFLTNFDLLEQTTLAVANYPIWELSRDNQTIAIKTDEDGLIKFQPELGSQEYELKLKSTKIRKVSDYISLISLLLLLTLVTINKKSSTMIKNAKKS